MNLDAETLCLCPFDSPSWDEIEADKRAREASKTAATVADNTWRAVLAALARIRDEGERNAAMQWVAYCYSTLGTVRRPVNVDRRHVLKFAALGVVDPLGFDYAETARPPTKRKFRGVNRGARFDRLDIMAAKLSPNIG